MNFIKDVLIEVWMAIAGLLIIFLASIVVAMVTGIIVGTVAAVSYYVFIGLT